MRIKPRIMVDLDGVVADYFGPFIDFVNDELGACYVMDDFRGYDNLKGIHPEDLRRMIIDFAKRGSIPKLPLMRGAKVGIKELSKLRDIVYCTSRTPLIAYDTVKWLEKKQIDYPVYFETDKLSFCSREHIDELVEDNPKVLHLATNCGIHCAYGIKARYNISEWNNNKVVFCKDLKEVAEYIASTQ